MRSLHEEELTPLVSTFGIHTVLRDTRTPYQKQLAMYLILASLYFETIAFYSIVTNLIVSMTPDAPRNWQPLHILIASFIFTGTSYFTTLIFAVVSDAKLGRPKTVLFGFAVYLIGYLLATVIRYPTIYNHTCLIANGTINSTTLTIFDEPCANWILPTLIIIAIGAGAVQSNMAALGAAQIQKTNITSRYFDKYMLALNSGAATTRLISSFITDVDTYFYVCAVTGTALAVAAALFVIGWRYYIDAKPYDSAIMMCLPVVINAFQSRSQYKEHKSLAVEENINSTSSTVNTMQVLVEEREPIITDPYPLTLLDFAKVPNGGKFHERIVDDVKLLRGAFVVFGFLIPYFILYSGFPLQGQQMASSDRRAVIWMSISEPVTVIIGILMLNKFLYNFLDTRNRPVSIRIKFIFGMIFACISMCLAGSVEVIRQSQCVDNNTPTNSSSTLTIVTQLPQNIALGLSEMLIVMASYEFAFYAAPRSARSLFMSLRFCSLAIASFIGAAYLASFSTNSSSITLNFSCFHLSDRKYGVLTYFYACAGLQLIFIILFIVFQRKLRIIE